MSLRGGGGRAGPSDDEVLAACVAEKTAHPEYGVKRVFAAMLAAHPEWGVPPGALKERRVQKVMKKHGLTHLPVAMNTDAAAASSAVSASSDPRVPELYPEDPVSSARQPMQRTLRPAPVLSTPTPAPSAPTPAPPVPTPDKTQASLLRPGLRVKLHSLTRCEELNNTTGTVFSSAADGRCSVRLIDRERSVRPANMTVLVDDVSDARRVLGVSPAATAVEIKAAYREACLTYHPDKNADPCAKEYFVAVYEAYKRLENPTTAGEAYKRLLESPATAGVDGPPRERQPWSQERQPCSPPTRAAARFAQAWAFFEQTFPGEFCRKVARAAKETVTNVAETTFRAFKNSLDANDRGIALDKQRDLDSAVSAEEQAEYELRRAENELRCLKERHALWWWRAKWAQLPPLVLSAMFVDTLGYILLATLFCATFFWLLCATFFWLHGVAFLMNNTESDEASKKVDRMHAAFESSGRRREAAASDAERAWAEYNTTAGTRSVGFGSVFRWATAGKRRQHTDGRCCLKRGAFSLA